MRKLLVLLLLAAGVTAQPILTPEITTEPNRLSTPAMRLAMPAVATAADRYGVVIAWGMRGRIHVARLDAAGNVAGDIRVMPVRSRNPNAIAVHPSIATRPSNEGFLLTWIETQIARPPGVFTFLDANLTPSAPELLPAVNEIKSPLIVRSGLTSNWLATEGHVWEVRSDGTFQHRFNTETPASDLTVAGDWPTAVSRREIYEGFMGPASIVWCGVCFERYSYQLRVTQQFHISAGAKVLPFKSPAEAAVEADGGTLLTAWFRGKQSEGGEVVLSVAPEVGAFVNALLRPIVLGRFGPDEGPMRPDIATNGKQHVIVWRTKTAKGDYDILGASIDRDGKLATFDVATSSADERDPSVLALPNGAFFIAYEKFLGGQRVIAWRTAIFDARRRAVR
jgi:hypothetical protein